MTPWTAAGFPIHHQLLELAQTHVHWVGDAILLSHPLSSPSPPAFSLSNHQGLFQWVSSSQQVAKASASASVLPKNIQERFPLGLTSLISLQSKRLSRVFSNTTVQKPQFFSTQLSLWSNFHIHTWLLEEDQYLSHFRPLPWTPALQIQPPLWHLLLDISEAPQHGVFQPQLLNCPACSHSHHALYLFLLHLRECCCCC